MQTVFANSQVAHVWAQQRQEEGRSHNGNLYFRGRALYSYGSHFVVGQFVTNARGERAVLLNSDSYSVSTSRHQSEAASAVRGLGIPVFHVPGARLDHAANLKAFFETVGRQAAAAKRSRVNRDHYETRAGETLEAGRAYAAFFGLKWKGGADLDSLTASYEAAKRREAARAKREAAAQRKADAANFALWRDGSAYWAPNSYRTDEKGGAYLRIRGEQLETSLGATVPLEHAIRAFRFLRRVRAAGKPWVANGHTLHVGHFAVDRIEANGDFRAGCHFIRWPEVERAAKQAGVWDAPEPDSEAAHAGA